MHPLASYADGTVATGPGRVPGVSPVRMRLSFPVAASRSSFMPILRSSGVSTAATGCRPAMRSRTGPLTAVALRTAHRAYSRASGLCSSSWHCCSRSSTPPTASSVAAAEGRPWSTLDSTHSTSPRYPTYGGMRGKPADSAATAPSTGGLPPTGGASAAASSASPGAPPGGPPGARMAPPAVAAPTAAADAAAPSSLTLRRCACTGSNA
eukprot:363662-Chlamydomonas_euryale.AAC.10